MTTKKRKSNFRGKVADDAHRQARAATSYGHLSLPKGVSVFSAEPGSRVKLDFLPYEVTDEKHPDRNKESEVAIVGSLWYKRPYKIHRNVGPENETIVCPGSIGKKCPVCEYRAKQIKAGADKADTDSIKVSLRNLYCVVPLDSKKHEAKPHIFDISQYNFQVMLNDELEENEDNEVFPDIEEGLTLKVRFASKTMGKSQPFAQASRIDFEEREEAYDESILKKVPNLDEVLTILSYDELHSKFFEMDDEDKDDDEDKPTRSKKSNKPPDDEEDDEDDTSKRSRKKKPLKSDDEEEDVDEEEEDEPVRKSKSHKAKDEDEDDDDEDEKPKRGTSSGRKKCPHGHKFGVDHEEYDECEDCKIWDTCLEENEK